MSLSLLLATIATPALAEEGWWQQLCSAAARRNAYVQAHASMGLYADLALFGDLPPLTSVERAELYRRIKQAGPADHCAIQLAGQQQLWLEPARQTSCPDGSEPYHKQVPEGLERGCLGPPGPGPWVDEALPLPRNLEGPGDGRFYWGYRTVEQLGRVVAQTRYERGQPTAAWAFAWTEQGMVVTLLRTYDFAGWPRSERRYDARGRPERMISYCPSSRAEQQRVAWPSGKPPVTVRLTEAEGCSPGDAAARYWLTDGESRGEESWQRQGDTLEEK